MDLGELQQLQILLQKLDVIICEAVVRLRDTNKNLSEFPGNVVITDLEIDSLLNIPPLPTTISNSNQCPILWDDISEIEHSVLKQLVDTFDLSSVDAKIILLTLAPQLDRRYERLYAYLQDDLPQTFPTVRLAMETLANDLPGKFEIWERLQVHMPLRSHGLILCSGEANPPNQTFLNHSLRLDHRIIVHLLGNTHIDHRIETAVCWYPLSQHQFLDEVITDDTLQVSVEESMVYLYGNDQLRHLQMARLHCSSIDVALVEIDASSITGLEVPTSTAWHLAIREAKLLKAGLLITHWESCLNSEGNPPPEVWGMLSTHKHPVFLSGITLWEPQDECRFRRILRLNVQPVSHENYVQIWVNALARFETTVDFETINDIATRYHFSSKKVLCAIQTAADHAALRDEPITKFDIMAGAQAQSQLRLGGLAQKIAPSHSWGDLVLPSDTVSQLRELCSRTTHRHRVIEQWGFGEKISRASGTSALFAGQSGTGKTMSAQILASELGLNLYRIDLSSVVSKYIGETEKNLSAIFSEAHSSNAILLFDEADALFGKRSEVRDAHDRYANIETAFLLQQMDDYQGIVILTTNLRQNLDDAFTRRLDFVIDFPFPDEDYRHLIWKAHFPEPSSLDPSVNFRELAKRYRLSGGNIRNAALASAYLAAADGGVISMKHIQRAVKREHQKMGRLLEEV